MFTSRREKGKTDDVKTVMCVCIYTVRFGAPLSLFAQEDFERVVSILLPLRHHLGAMGGSKGQQDVVHVTLIDAALRLPDVVGAVLSFIRSLFFSLSPPFSHLVCVILHKRSRCHYPPLNINAARSKVFSRDDFDHICSSGKH